MPPRRYDNELGDAGAIEFAEVLKVNKVLSTLDLHTCEIGDTGADALLDAVRGSYTIKKLELSFNKILIHTEEEIEAAVAENTDSYKLEQKKSRHSQERLNAQFAAKKEEERAARATDL